MPPQEAPKLLDNRYEIKKLIGSGGTCQVFMAFDHRLERSVAIKTVKSSFHPKSSKDIFERIKREAVLAGKLNHPNILAIHDVFEHRGFPFIVMEFLYGVTLREELLKRGRLDLDEALKIITPVARGLDFAHENGVIHRDIKPANIMLCYNGVVKIMDFGVAKAVLSSSASGTEPGVVVGTYQYMAPELFINRSVDHRADVYSLGAMLFEMLTGYRPFDSDSVHQLMNAILLLPVPQIHTVRTDLPPELDPLFQKCLDKDVESRYTKCADFVEALYEVHALPSDGMDQPLAEDTNSLVEVASEPGSAPPLHPQTAKDLITPVLNSQAEQTDMIAEQIIGPIKKTTPDNELKSKAIIPLAEASSTIDTAQAQKTSSKKKSKSRKTASTARVVTPPESKSQNKTSKDALLPEKPEPPIAQQAVQSQTLAKTKSTKLQPRLVLPVVIIVLLFSVLGMYVVFKGHEQPAGQLIADIPTIAPTVVFTQAPPSGLTEFAEEVLPSQITVYTDRKDIDHEIENAIDELVAGFNPSQLLEDRFPTPLPALPEPAAPTEQPAKHVQVAQPGSAPLESRKEEARPGDSSEQKLKNPTLENHIKNAQSLINKGEYAQAEEAAQRALKIDPRSESALTMLRNARDAKQIQGWITEAQAAFAHDDAARVAELCVLILARDTENQIALDLQKKASVQLKSKELFNQATGHYQAGNYDAARKALESLTKVAPDHADGIQLKQKLDTPPQIEQKKATFDAQNKKYLFEITVKSDKPPIKAVLFYRAGDTAHEYVETPMQARKALTFNAEVPAKEIKKREANYYITVRDGAGNQTVTEKVALTIEKSQEGSSNDEIVPFGF